MLEVPVTDWKYVQTSSLPDPKVNIPGTNKALYLNIPNILPNTKFMYSVDLFFRVDPELLTITQDFAADKDHFIRVFKKAWTKLANMDRYLEFQYCEAQARVRQGWTRDGR